MDYLPIIESANTIGSSPLGEDHIVILLDQIKSAGSIEYTYLLGVFEKQSRSPVYFVSSEVNSAAPTLGGGSHFLGAFDGNSHLNFGHSDDWSNAKKFFPKAIELAAKHFGVQIDISPR